MKDAQEQSRFKVFTRRAAVLGGVQTLMFGALAARLYDLQVNDADLYRTLADDNRINLRLLPPVRGGIFDRDGRILAENRKNYRVTYIPEQAADSGVSATETLSRLSEIVPLAERDVARILKEMKRKRSFVPITVFDNLNWEQLSQIEVNSLHLPGIVIDVGLTRHYPFGADVSHILGYVGSPSERELTGDPVLELPDFRIGKNGVEKVYDLALRGSSGTSQVEVNAFGRVIKELQRDDGERGQDVVLTVDVDLQKAMMRRIEAERSASCVVMDCETGEVYAIGSTPTYDSNLFARGISSKDWSRLREDKLGPLTNKATTGLYSPGSVFKMAVALAILENGEDPNETITCNGHVDLNAERFHCWKRAGHGPMDMVEALSQSCDVYFYEMSQRVGIEKIAEVAKRLGFDAPTGLDLPTEVGGRIPTMGWKRARFDKPWTRGETLVASIGQGFVLSTPLQNAVYLARLVNGGKMVVPHLAARRYVEGQAPEDFAPWPDGEFDPEHLALLRRAMERVVNHQRGTAYWTARLPVAGVEMAGKTGTAQVRRITMKERESGVLKNEELEWKYRDHALFVGYAPAERPRYVVSVVVEHGGGGGSVAAPIVRDIMTETLKRDPARDRSARNVAEAVGPAVDPSAGGPFGDGPRGSSSR